MSLAETDAYHRPRRLLRDGRRSGVVAALDLGTNNCRLLIARPRNTGFEVVDAFSRIVRLGEGLALTGELAEEAMDRTVAALRICASKLRRHAPIAARIVGTEACRRAGNGASFLERVRVETGLEIESISAAEEAVLALAGCSALLSRRVPKAIVFDIGGGSTEVMWLDVPAAGPPAVQTWISLPTGVVSLADRMGADAGTPQGYARMRAEVESLLAPFEERHQIAAAVARGEVQMLGTSGTVTTLAGIHLELARYDRSQVDGLLIDFSDLDAVSQRLRAMDPDERVDHPCIGRTRADLVIAGCAILDAMCGMWPVGKLRIADRGVREGILLGLMGVPAPRLTDGRPPSYAPRS